MNHTKGCTRWTTASVAKDAGITSLASDTNVLVVRLQMERDIAWCAVLLFETSRVNICPVHSVRTARHEAINFTIPCTAFSRYVGLSIEGFRRRMHLCLLFTFMRLGKA